MMSNTEILDNDDFADKNEKIMSALTWWEKKRILFNLIVGALGVIGVFISPISMLKINILAVIFYGLMANLFYSVGFLLEAFDLYYFKSKLQLFRFRLVLFVIGLLVVGLVTFLGALFNPFFI
jgi:hypothetical protein